MKPVAWVERHIPLLGRVCVALMAVLLVLWAALMHIFRRDDARMDALLKELRGVKAVAAVFLAEALRWGMAALVITAVCLMSGCAMRFAPLVQVERNYIFTGPVNQPDVSVTKEIKAGGMAK